MCQLLLFSERAVEFWRLLGVGIYNIPARLIHRIGCSGDAIILDVDIGQAANLPSKAEVDHYYYPASWYGVPGQSHEGYQYPQESS